MKLDQIRFHIEMGEKFSINGINGSINMIPHLFLHHLKNYETNGIRRVTIKLTQKISMQNFISPLESVLVFSTFFDIAKFREADNYHRKLIGLNIILESLLYIAEKRGWQNDPLLDAYNACMKRNLVFEGVYKNKSFQSPDRKYLAQLHYNWDSDKYEATAVLYNKKKEELHREKILECDPSFVERFSFVGWDKRNPNRFMITLEYPHREHVAELIKA